MRRVRSSCRARGRAALTACTGSDEPGEGCGVSPPRRKASSTPAHPSQKVVFIVKENRTFDNMFGRFPGADGARHGFFHDGTRVPLTRRARTSIRTTSATISSRAWSSSTGAEMNGFDLIPGGREPLGFTQYHREDIPNYWRYRGNLRTCRPHVLVDVWTHDPGAHVHRGGHRGERRLQQADTRGRPGALLRGCPRAFHKFSNTTVDALGTHRPVAKIEATPQRIPLASTSGRSSRPGGEGHLVEVLRATDQFHNALLAVEEIRLTDRWKNVGIRSDSWWTLGGQPAAVSYVLPPNKYNEHPHSRRPQHLCRRELDGPQVNAVMGGPIGSAPRSSSRGTTSGAFTTTSPPQVSTIWALAPGSRS